MRTAKQTKESVAYVILIEYERGWSSREADRIFFDDVLEAQRFITKFNTESCPPRPIAPDWYMVAEGPYKVEPFVEEGSRTATVS